MRRLRARGSSPNGRSAALDSANRRPRSRRTVGLPRWRCVRALPRRGSQAAQPNSRSFAPRASGGDQPPLRAVQRRVRRASRSSSPSTTRRRSSTPRSSTCASGSTPFGWTLRDHPRRERLARSHRRHRRGAAPRSTREVRFFSHGRAELRQGAEQRDPTSRAARSSSATRSTSATPTSTAARSSCSRPAKLDMVIGSKLIAGAEDDRPWARHAASLALQRPAPRRRSASAAPTRTASRPSVARRSSTSRAPASSRRTCSRASS